MPLPIIAGTITPGKLKNSDNSERYDLKAASMHQQREVDYDLS